MQYKGIKLPRETLESWILKKFEEKLYSLTIDDPKADFFIGIIMFAMEDWLKNTQQQKEHRQAAEEFLLDSYDIIQYVETLGINYDWFYKVINNISAVIFAYQQKQECIARFRELRKLRHSLLQHDSSATVKTVEEYNENKKKIEQFKKRAKKEYKMTPLISGVPK